MKSSLKVVSILFLFFSFIIACNNGKDKTNEGKIENDSTSVLNTDSNVTADTSILSAIDDSLAPVEPIEVSTQEETDPLKIGHINSNEILALMPDIKAADTQLQNFAQQLDSEIKRQYDEYQQKYAALMTDTTLPKAVMEAKAQELASLEATITQLQQSSQDQVLQKKDALYQPILAKIDRAIQAVAKEQHYTYIIDASTGTLVYGIDTYDITPFVKRRLGI